jgi:hypothetical protein
MHLPRSQVLNVIPTVHLVFKFFIPLGNNLMLNKIRQLVIFNLVHCTILCLPWRHVKYRERDWREERQPPSGHAMGNSNLLEADCLLSVHVEQFQVGVNDPLMELSPVRTALANGIGISTQTNARFKCHTY